MAAPKKSLQEQEQEKDQEPFSLYILYIFNFDDLIKHLLKQTVNMSVIIMWLLTLVNKTFFLRRGLALKTWIVHSPEKLPIFVHIML